MTPMDRATPPHAQSTILLYTELDRQTDRHTTTACTALDWRRRAVKRTIYEINEN